MKCADEHGCSDDSNLALILKSPYFMTKENPLNLTNLESLKSSYKSLCGKLIIYFNQ